jgi:hypothetical protein
MALERTYRLVGINILIGTEACQDSFQKNLGTKWPGLKVYPARLLTLGRKIRIANCGLEKTFG